MITTKKKLKLIKACFGEYKLSADSNNASVVCSACLSAGKVTSKKKLSIDLKEGIYHCWVCEVKGRNVGVLALNYVNQVDAAKNLKKIYRKKNEKPDVLEEAAKERISLPDDFKLIYNLQNTRMYSKHFQYLLDRGFTQNKMKKFRIGVSEELGFSNRVIFPSFDHDQNLNYFISRSIDPKSTFRYKNAKCERKNVIFRQIDLDMSKELILTEGVFDLVNCPENSTCILGSWISSEYLLFKEIVKNQTPVILCFDPDAKSKTMKIAKLLHAYCVDVKISQHDINGKDFGDMSKSEVNYFISTAKRYDNASRLGYLINELHSGSIY